MAELQQITLAANAEVNCPVGWGKVRFYFYFGGKRACPISGVEYCKDCEAQTPVNANAKTGKDIIKKRG